MNSYAVFQMEGVTHDGLPFNQPLPNPYPAIGRKSRPALLYIPPVEVPPPSPSPLWHMPKQPELSYADRRRRRHWQDDPVVPAASEPTAPLPEPRLDSIRAAVAPAAAARRSDETVVTIPLREIQTNGNAACVDRSSARRCFEEKRDSHVIDLAAELRAYREKFQQLQKEKERQEKESLLVLRRQRQQQQEEVEQRQREEEQRRQQEKQRQQCVEPAPISLHPAAQLMLQNHKASLTPTSTISSSSSSSSTRKYRESWLCAVDATKLWSGLVDGVCGVPEVSAPAAWAPATSAAAGLVSATSASEVLAEMMKRSESLDEILCLRDVIVKQLEKRDVTGINSPRSVFSPNLSIASSGVSPSGMCLE